MAATMHLTIAIFLLTTICWSLVNAHYSRFVPLISEIRSQSQTSGVMFMCSSHRLFRDELETAHELTRVFSKQGVLTMVSNFGYLNKCLSYYEKRIGRPLVVILVRSYNEIVEFNEGMENMDKSFPLWLMVFYARSGNSLCEHCRNPVGNMFHVRYDTSMLVVCCNDVTLREWWSASHNKTEMRDIGTWMVGKSLKLSASNALLNQRHDIRGIGLRIVYVRNSPFVRVRDGELGGLFGDFFNVLNNEMGFDIVETMPVDGFGIFNCTTNRWTGAMGVLQRGEADLVLGITMTESRNDVVDFTYPILQSPRKLFIRKPDSTVYNWSAHAEVFEPGLWVILLGLVITVPLLLAFIKKSQRKSESLASSYFDDYILVWGILCQQAMFQFPAKTPMKVAYYSVFVSGIVVSAAYSATLISFFTVSIGGLSYSTFAKFAADESYKLIVNQNSAYYESLNNSKDPFGMKLMALLKPDEQLPSNQNEAWNQVCSERVAFITSDAEKKLHERTCNVIGMETGVIDSLSMALSNGSQYTSIINHHIQRLKGGGLIRRLEANHYRQENTDEANFETVEFSRVAPVLRMLGSASIVSLIIWLSEMIIHAIVNRKRRRLPSAELGRNKIIRSIGVRESDKIFIGKSRMSGPLQDVKLDPSFIGYYP